MKISMQSLVFGFLLIFSMASLAAPKKVDLEYQVTRNGQPFATINEHYQADNARYTIESTTKGKGVYALLGKRVLTSEGEITLDGLKPVHFETLQNNKKNLISDFNWSANTLTLNNKGNIETVPLQKGAQDLTSFSYQFMFDGIKGDEVSLPLTTGRNLRIYTYKVIERNIALETPAGQYKTVHLINASSDPKDDKKELWLSPETQSLPVKIIIHDETGATIEQVLSSVHVE